MGNRGGARSCSRKSSASSSLRRRYRMAWSRVVRAVSRPTARRLANYLASLPASDKPNAFIFPHTASAKRTASLSNQFRDILVEAGLVEPLRRGHKSTGKGRNQAREASEISFHSLRHSAVTMLKAAAVSDFMAREIVGHESTAVSRQYTHLTTDDKRAAMQPCRM